MASASVNFDNTAATHGFYCHVCRRTVRIVPDPTSPLNCPICSRGFLEEVLTANLDPNQDLNHAAALSNPRNPSTHNPNAHRVSEGLFNIQEYVRNVRAQGPPRTSIQFVFGDDAEPSRSIEPGLQEIIDNLAQSDDEEIVPTPASKISIERLSEVAVDENILRSEMTNCAICQDKFKNNMILKQMPCNHLFHSHCLLTWLGMGNTCPLCRYPLEIEDQPDVNLMAGNAEFGGVGHALRARGEESIEDQLGGSADASRATVEESIADRVRMRRRGMRNM